LKEIKHILSIFPFIPSTKVRAEFWPRTRTSNQSTSTNFGTSYEHWSLITNCLYPKSKKFS